MPPLFAGQRTRKRTAEQQTDNAFECRKRREKGGAGAASHRNTEKTLDLTKNGRLVKYGYILLTKFE